MYNQHIIQHYIICLYKKGLEKNCKSIKIRKKIKLSIFLEDMICMWKMQKNLQTHYYNSFHKLAKFWIQGQYKTTTTIFLEVNKKELENEI